TIPRDRIGNDRAIQITDERWESPDLSLLVYSKFSDPRTAVIEFKLANISRTEPAPTCSPFPRTTSSARAPVGVRARRPGGMAAGRLQQQVLTIGATRRL